MNIKNPDVRRYIYLVALAAIPILVLTGLLTNDQVAPVTNLTAAILGLGTTALALPNTPGGRHES